MISALILTLNEELDLSGCIESLNWCDDIVVFDSKSVDRTAEIAASMNARVYERDFDDYASQRNAALSEVEFKHPWVLMIDADERFPLSLINEIKEELISKGDDNSISLYHMRRKDIFMGKWIKRSSGYPTWFGRLARVGHVEVRRSINEEYHTKGEKGYLRGHFTHYPFSKGIAHWVDKHNRYSTMEAEAFELAENNVFELHGLFSFDPAIRRKALKQVVYRLPCRPFLVFVALYFVRLGLLDGSAGFNFCVLRSIYEHLIDLKKVEIKQHRFGALPYNQPPIKSTDYSGS